MTYNQLTVATSKSLIQGILKTLSLSFAQNNKARYTTSYKYSESMTKTKKTLQKFLYVKDSKQLLLDAYEVSRQEFNKKIRSDVKLTNFKKLIYVR